LWGMADENGPEMAEEFYKHMLGPGGGDCTEAATALSKALKVLRETPGVPFRRWVNFVHFGI